MGAWHWGWQGVRSGASVEVDGAGDVGRANGTAVEDFGSNRADWASVLATVGVGSASEWHQASRRAARMERAGSGWQGGGHGGEGRLSGRIR